MYLCLIRHQTKLLYGKSGEIHVVLTKVSDRGKLLHVQALYPQERVPGTTLVYVDCKTKSLHNF